MLLDMNSSKQQAERIKLCKQSNSLKVVKDLLTIAIRAARWPRDKLYSSCFGPCSCYKEAGQPKHTVVHLWREPQGILHLQEKLLPVHGLKSEAIQRYLCRRAKSRMSSRITASRRTYGKSAATDTTSQHFSWSSIIHSHKHFPPNEFKTERAHRPYII